MTTKVCIYTRVSTIMQVDGFSLIGQEEEIRKYCASHNMEIVATYSDKGKSGKTLAGREDFQKMIMDIDTGVINVKYVMVYKLSRFGRSVLDIERTLQILRENDVNLICVADGLDTSTPMGKVITTIMSSLAEMELENIHTQTMLGRQQKARDGLWNGGFAPYGYALENGHLVINDDEADAIKKIFELYTTTELGIVGIVKWLFKHGYRKEIRANGTRDVFTRAFVSKALDNPVYKGEIAYGRRHMLPPDKKGERKMVKRDDYIRAVGKHEPIITEEQYEAAQQKRKTLAPLAHKREDSTHVHMLATLVKCPVCGAPLYGNTTRKKKKGTEDEYTPYHFYACKHRLRVDGKPCTFRKNLNEKNIDEPVIAIITKLAGDKRLAELVADKLGDVVDEQETVKAIETTEREIRIRESSLKRLSSELDRIDPEAPYAERRIKDTNARIDELYEELAGFETDLADFKQKLEAIRQKKLTVEKVYTVLQHFGTLIDVITEEECQMLMRTLIDEIQIFEDKQPDGRIVKSVKLSIPVVYDGEISARIGLDKNDHDESIVTLSKGENGL